MFCSNCGKTLKGDAAACPHCGAMVGESRFEGNPYIGAQVRTKPGEAVRLPGNHTKTTFMGTKPKLDEEADARTTYRATADQVYDYKEEDAYPPDENYEDEYTDEAAEYTDEAAEYAEDVPENEDNTEGEYEFDEPAETEAPEETASEEAAAEAEGAPSFEDTENAEEEAPLNRRQRREQREALKKALEEEEEEEEAPKPKKLSRKERRIQEEDALVDAELEEIRIREIRVDDSKELSEGLRQYRESGRYDELPEEPERRKPEKAKKSRKKAEKKSAFLRFKRHKRHAEEDFDALTPDEFEVTDDESAFDISDLPEEETSDESSGIITDEADQAEELPEAYDESAEDEEAAYADEYSDEEFSDETFSQEDFTEEELQSIDDEAMDEIGYKRRLPNLSPKAMNIMKYAAAALVLALLITGAVLGLGRIADKTKTAPIDQVTLDLYEKGIALMKSRADGSYERDILNGYDGSMSKMLQITDRITADLDAISAMLPENQSVNDKRFIDALSTIQNDINSAIVNDMLAISDTSKTEAERQAESDRQWKQIRDIVDVLSKATSTAQLDLIIKGERIEVIQQATAEPSAAQATPTPPPYSVLSSGSKSDAVRELQTRLSNLNYPIGVVDGSYGPKTKTCVQLFQKAANLKVTGIADVETQIALFAEDAPRYN